MSTEATIQTTFEGLKGMAKEYCQALPTLDRDGVESGFKCFALAYLGCDFPETVIGNLQREIEAPALMKIVSRARLERDCQLDRRKGVFA